MAQENSMLRSMATRSG